MKVDILTYIETEKIIHNWIRFLGTFGRTYIKSQPDDGHTNLNWNNLDKRFETRATQEGIFMCYCLDKNQFHLRNKNEQLSIPIELKQKGLSDIESEIIDVVENLHLNSSELFTHLNFKYLELFNADNIQISPNKEAVDLQSLIRDAANHSCQNLIEAYNQESEIRVWPHNFDTGIHCKYDNGLEQFAGYSPADEGTNATPYFYNGFYKEGKKVFPKSFSPLTIGYWETDKWGGAILPIRDITVDDYTKQPSLFLIESTKHFLNNL